MSDLLVNINSAERRAILTVGTDLSIKIYPFVYFLLINLPVSSVGSVYPSFCRICIFESIRLHPSEAIKIKGPHEREVKEKCTTRSSQLAGTSNSHDSQFTCSP